MNTGILDTVEEARLTVAKWISHYNNERLHSAIGYVFPNDMMNGRAKDIHKIRDERFENARELRRKKYYTADSKCEVMH